MSYTACDVMIRWVSQSVVHVAVPLRNELSLPLGNIGMWSTSCVLSVRSHSWGTATMNARVWHTARPITTSCLETCALSATLLSMVMVSVWEPGGRSMSVCMLSVYSRVEKDECMHASARLFLFTLMQELKISLN